LEIAEGFERRQVLARIAAVESRSEHPIAREQSIAYVNVAGILELVRPQIEPANPQAWPTIEKLGLTHVTALHALTGYDEEGCASFLHVVTKDASRPGLLGLKPHAPLEAADLAPIPQDALLALAASIDAAELFDRGKQLAEKLEPRAGEHLERALWEIETKLGVDVRNDVLASLDDAWVVYLPGGDLMTAWLNSAAAVRVKDAEALRAAMGKLVRAAREELARQSGPASIVETDLDGRTMYSLQFNEPAPVSPSWCVGDGWLVMGLTPMAARAALERGAENSLAQSERVAAALDAEGGVAALAYQDTPRLVRSIYPWIGMGLQMASGELRKQGVNFSITTLPTEEVVVKHLRPSIATLAHREDGFHFTSHGSLPGGGNLAAAAPIGAGLLIPAVAGARAAAMRSQDMNDMRQIALAMHNYHDVHNSFPTDVYSEDGKPLLSWRVELLPYMEQQGLYERFKLDEPWDSEHNRKLLAQIPEAFLSSAGGEPGKTRYQGLKGEKTIFRGAKGVAVREITDGTSNTLMFVQTDPAKAVEWTRPADINFDAKKPLAGLDSSQGAFLAAFCDGSVQYLSMAPGDEALKRLAIRDDGETIDRTALPGPAAPNLPHSNSSDAVPEPEK
ncbi:MAG: hypothetical protein DCC67_15425, partial [Planctomycetota bacterium]